MKKRICPFCNVEMIRPREGIIRIVNYGLIEKEHIISDEPMIEFKYDYGKKSIKYNDYMCPQCDVVLLYCSKENLK